MIPLHNIRFVTSRMLYLPSYSSKKLAMYLYSTARYRAVAMVAKVVVWQLHAKEIHQLLLSLIQHANNL